MYFPTNCRIRKIERMGSMDRYGNETREVVYADVLARLEIRSMFVRSANGDVKPVDGRMFFGPGQRMVAGDRVTLESAKPEVFLIFDVSEYHDVSGVVEMTECRVVRQVYAV